MPAGVTEDLRSRVPRRPSGDAVAGEPYGPRLLPLFPRFGSFGRIERPPDTRNSSRFRIRAPEQPPVLSKVASWPRALRRAQRGLLQPEN